MNYKRYVLWGILIGTAIMFVQEMLALPVWLNPPGALLRWIWLDVYKYCDSLECMIYTPALNALLWAVALPLLVAIANKRQKA